MPDGYVILDDDGQVADSNSRARDLLVRTAGEFSAPAEVEGRSLEALLDDVEYVDGGDLDGRVVVDDGDLYVDLQSTVLEDDGYVIGRLVTLRDVTDEVLAERRLERERREFETLFTNMSDPVAKVGFDGAEPLVAAVNPAFAETFGVGVDAVVDEPIGDAIVPEDHRETAADLYQRIHAGESIRREVRRETPDGPRDFLLRSALVNPGDAGDRTAYVIYTDITDEKRRRRRLERQNERLDQFASIVSHDLRNPLTVARGLLDTIDESDDLEETVREAIHSLDRMEAMIGDVLTLARQGRDVGEVDAVSLDAVARAAWRTVETGTASLTVADDGAIMADPDRLLQLFENLFRNALEHGAGGGRPGDEVDGDEVAVTVGTLPDGAGFYVEDDGPGIPPDRRDAVFEHGYSTERDGTGFGLSIVDGIATAHGWSCKATAAASGGARFEFTGVERARGDVGSGVDPEEAGSSGTDRH